MLCFEKRRKCVCFLEEKNVPSLRNRERRSVFFCVVFVERKIRIL